MDTRKTHPACGAAAINTAINAALNAAINAAINAGQRHAVC